MDLDKKLEDKDAFSSLIKNPRESFRHNHGNFRRQLIDQETVSKD